MGGGKQHCESTGTSNKRVAKKILAIRLAAIAEGRFSGLLKSHAPTLKNYLSKYLDSRTDLQPNTRTPYAVSRRSSGKLLWRHSASRHHGCPNRGIQRSRIRGGSGPAGVKRGLSLLRLLLKQARKDRYSCSESARRPRAFSFRETNKSSGTAVHTRGRAAAAGGSDWLSSAAPHAPVGYRAQTKCRGVAAEVEKRIVFTSVDSARRFVCIGRLSCSGDTSVLDRQGETQDQSDASSLRFFSSCLRRNG